MEWLLIPISMLIKNFSFSLPGIIGTLPVYLFTLLLFFKWVTQPDLFGQLMVSRRVLIGTFAFGISQLIMIFYSYQITNRPQDTSGLSTGPVNVFLFIANLFLVYYLLQVVISDQHKALGFIRSLLITYVVFGILVLIPQIVATRSHLMDGWVNFLGRMFEAEHQGRFDFYRHGSYATTQRRVNGFSQEASFLAAMIGIVFLPIVMAAIKNRYDYFSGKLHQRQWFYWVLLIFSFIVLFFAKTSTGFIVIALAVVILFFASSASDQRRYLKAGVVALVLLVVLYIADPGVQAILQKYVLNKQGTDNRLGGTIALFLTFLHYPLFGVGRGYTSYYSFLYVPKSTIANPEYFMTFVQTGYPDQSVWGEIFASYGLVTIVPTFLYLYHKVKTALNLKRFFVKQTDSSSILYVTILDSFFYTLIMFAVLAIFTFSWNDEIYFVIFFFYIVIINRVSGELKIER
ncbi:hypothetical protein BSQ39_05435 [Loigolactobacillus backii]|uniref:hypothetical protein n=1 Tax=Loigolactobacillus backii TaxID=375175 RepID=UPI000C1CB1F2|nr:hypothetical protein [Loigolactobacillus backii]PIO83055.1 hypothetical protein BSQ39_05435 [Loigolactobacillus backii]